MADSPKAVQNSTPASGDKSKKATVALSQTQRAIIINAIKSRSNNRRISQVNLKLFFWRFTINSTKAVKRFCDVVISLAALVVLFPFFLALGIAIRLESKGRIIYRQVRVGKDGRHFYFYKFRSMYSNADEIKKKLMAQNESKDGVIFKMKKDPRVTRIGRFIRKFSIDELPQLFNVIIGDMSLVGPRPPTPDEVAHYTLEERKRLHVLPGITCTWQVSGRSDIPFKKQVELDKKYISSQGLWSDFMILLKTIPAVFTGRGAY